MQSTSERRRLILRALCERRHENVTALADEFCVSERTVRRDIEILSLSSPIYTSRGRHGGGVYVLDGYYPDRRYLDETEAEVLNKTADCIERGEVRGLCQKDIETIKRILKRFAKPAL